MSESVRSHRRQPTRLPRPWDSQGKNTRVGCHFLRCRKVKSESAVIQSCPTLSDPMNCSLQGSSVHGIFQAKYWSGVPLKAGKLYKKLVVYSYFGGLNEPRTFWNEHFSVFFSPVDSKFDLATRRN